MKNLDGNPEFALGLPGAYVDHPWEETVVKVTRRSSCSWGARHPDVARDHGEAPGFERGGQSAFSATRPPATASARAGDRPARHAEGAPFRRAHRLGRGELSPRGAEAPRRRARLRPPMSSCATVGPTRWRPAKRRP
jgi:hypothetical protein